MTKNPSNNLIDTLASSERGFGNVSNNETDTHEGLVLIVDDSPADRFLYERLLTSESGRFEIVRSETPEEGLEFAERHSPDCILLDYMMPRISGVDFLAEMKRLDIHVPVVILTGESDAEVSAEFFKAGANDYLIKGRATVANLTDTVSKAIRSGKVKGIASHQASKTEAVAEQEQPKLDLGQTEAAKEAKAQDLVDATQSAAADEPAKAEAEYVSKAVPVEAEIVAEPAEVAFEAVAKTEQEAVTPEVEVSKPVHPEAAVHSLTSLAAESSLASPQFETVAKLQEHLRIDSAQKQASSESMASIEERMAALLSTMDSLLEVETASPKQFSELARDIQPVSNAATVPVPVSHVAPTPTLTPMFSAAPTPTAVVEPMSAAASTPTPAAAATLTAAPSFVPTHAQDMGQFLFDGLDELVLAVDVGSGKIMNAGRRGVENLGYSIDAIKGQELANTGLLGAAASWQEFQDVLTGADSQRRNMAMRRKDGATIDMEIWASIARDNQTDYWLIVARDVSNYKAVEKSLRQMVETDDITGFLNRRGIEQQLLRRWGQCALSQTSMALLFVEISHYGQYVDALGDRSASTIIEQVALAVSGEVRRESDLIGRYNNNTFAILLNGPDEQKAYQLMNAIVDAVAKIELPAKVQDLGKLTVIAGAAALLPSIDVSAADLIRSAEAMLRESRTQGGVRANFQRAA